METKNKLAASSGRMTRLVRLLRAACRTNDTQVSACLLLSGPQVIAAIMSDTPWWGCVLVGLIWPAVAFLANFTNPIPPNVKSDGNQRAELDAGIQDESGQPSGLPSTACSLLSFFEWGAVADHSGWLLGLAWLGLGFAGTLLVYVHADIYRERKENKRKSRKDPREKQ